MGVNEKNIWIISERTYSGFEGKKRDIRREGGQVFYLWGWFCLIALQVFPAHVLLHATDATVF